MKKLEVRKPAVAGQFYAGTTQGLKNQISALVSKTPEKIDANIMACILPHAGYMYSGRVAAQTVSRVPIRSTVILLGPNHTGNGAAFSIMTEGTWQTPLGEVTIDTDFAKALLKNSTFLEDDALAHQFEHSLEVELPFLQFFKPDFSIVPIALLTDNLRALKEVGREIADTITAHKKQGATLLIASTDMTHYESQEDAMRKDKQAIEAILELNEDKLAERIRRLNITMCGYAPVIALLSAVKQLGAHSATLVKYETSGDVTGDKESVVGYAGITIT